MAVEKSAERTEPLTAAVCGHGQRTGPWVTEARRRCRLLPQNRNLSQHVLTDGRRKLSVREQDARVEHVHTHSVAIMNVVVLGIHCASNGSDSDVPLINSDAPAVDAPVYHWFIMITAVCAPNLNR